MGFQLSAQFWVVVNGTVEHDAQAQLGVQHGLLGMFGAVHHPQATVPHRNATLGEQAVAIRAARAQYLRHARHGIDIGRLAIKANLGGKTAHKSSS